MRGEGRRVLFLVLDGAADRPAAALDGRTPLEAAETPALDRLVSAGVSGLVDVGAPGTPLPSDRAHARLFGYDPATVPRRGVLEARGLGVEVPDEGVTCSANLAALEKPGGGPPWTIADRSLSAARDRCGAAADRVGRFDSGTVSVSLEYTWKNRGILTLTAPDPLSPAVTDTDPFEAGLPVVRPEPTEEGEAAARVADALADYTRFTIDAELDAGDVVLSKWAAAPTDPPSFAARYDMDAAAVTPKPVLAGLGGTLGMDVIDPPSAYDARAETVGAALDTHDFVHAHYPEPDEIAHAGTPAEKRRELEAIDDSLGPLVDRVLEEGIVAVVTADHTTPSVGNVVHSGEPVFATVAAPTVRTDGVDRLGERPAADGGLGRIGGTDLLRVARAAADRVLLEGLRRTPAGGTAPRTDLTPLGGSEP